MNEPRRDSIKIEFSVNGKLYKFNNDRYNNITIQRWEAKKEYWRRVSGFHNMLSIQRELAEYFAPNKAATIENYYEQLIATLADISMQLGALINNAASNHNDNNK